MALDPLLLEILACPEDKGPLFYFPDEDALYNPRLHRRYAVRDDIPIMLVEEAETVDEGEHDRLVARAAAEGIEPTFDPGAFPPVEGREATEDPGPDGPPAPGTAP
ncbi:MAG TPA: Trm112 family protein [Acidimicrobiales bacterium]|nr:Trm112 family protein [Acidimicrobiales bacterium]